VTYALRLAAQAARWKMHSVCKQPSIKACDYFEQGDRDTVETDRCSLCEAITKDVYRITRMARERPTDPANASYAPLKQKMDSVCDDLELWRRIPSDREKVAEECPVRGARTQCAELAHGTMLHTLIAAASRAADFFARLQQAFRQAADKAHRHLRTHLLQRSGAGLPSQAGESSLLQ
jgi:hypothetical protein